MRITGNELTPAGNTGTGLSGRHTLPLVHWEHASSAGLTLRGEHSVPSGKPVLHVLHGNGFCGLTYWPLLEQLMPHFDLFLSDVQGHGNSDDGGRFHGWNRTADLCIEAWQAHSHLFPDAPVMMLGHSFGGVLSCLMMAHQPSLAKRAVLLDPVLFTPTMIGLMALSDVVGLYSRNMLAQRARKRRHHWPNRETARQLLSNKGMFKGWTDESMQAYIDHALRDAPDGGVELKCKPQREAEIFGSFPKRLWSSLKRVSAPTLVMYGRKTYPFISASVTRWQAGNTNVKSMIVDGGHCFMQEYPQITAQRVTDFLLAQAG